MTYSTSGAKGLDTNSGEDGEAGEDCGTICIFSGDLEIYAYGGAGGAGGYDSSSNSGSGAGGYPAAGIGRWRCWTVDGADHCFPAGGYTVGNGETGRNTAGNNGSGNLYYGRSGGGYYTTGGTSSYSDSNYFNQGGFWYTTLGFHCDYSGSGGNAGAGGIIYYSDLSKIHAYNGDRITNGDYDTVYYEYNADGTLTETIANVVTKLDEAKTKIVPAKIFAQEGIIRATYKTNQHMTEEEAKSYGVQYIDDSIYAINVQITAETTTPVTDYGQGIGSGAGNLEKSNGTLKNISEYSE